MSELPIVLDHLPNLSAARVLLIDDEGETRVLLRAVLEQCNAEVRDAATVDEGLEIVAAWGPSIIVSDIGMPGADGYDFVRRLRAMELERGAWTPAVALTAYARAEDRVKALSAGYQVHVAKPINPLEFALVIAGQLARQR
jgi:CheY-like chemotaxis protein